MTYSARFTQAASETLGDGFTVTDSQGIVLIEHRDSGSAIASAFMPNVDRRKHVDQTDVRRFIEEARGRLLGNSRHFKPEHFDKARVLCTELRKVIDTWKAA